MNFKEGDKVVVRRNGSRGTVTYAEAGYICVELDNGVEMDFEDSVLLQLASEYEAERNGKSSIMAEMGATELPVSKVDLTDFKGMPYYSEEGDDKLAEDAIAKIERIYPPLIDAAIHRNEDFRELAAIEQIKLLSEMTGTPVVIFLGGNAMFGEAMRDGMMIKVLQKTMINNLSSGNNDLIGDMLMGKIKRTLGKL